MRIYNTLTRKKEEFKPINPPNVLIYVCGPTVYDYFHIGNARSFIMSDIIRRYLEYKGYSVKFAMNLTDIDDKIIKKSIAEKISSAEVAAKYSNAFFEDAGKLKIKKADVHPKATENIAVIIELITRLEELGYAYCVNGDVFFNVAKFKDYGKLSGKKIEELEAGARVEINESKKNPLDFSLWKKAKEGEPHWSSPWGEGRPGWHIECSAMSRRELGETIDIHAGGSDLIFPHHENEIAQSEAASGKDFVKYWMHFGFLNIQTEVGEAQKMSKSLGNFLTAREALKIYSAETIRFFFSQTHYASPLNFSEEAINSAQKGLEKIHNLARELQRKSDSFGGEEFEFDFKKYYMSFENAMDDDFNSPQAVAAIFDFARDVNKILSERSYISENFITSSKKFLKDTAENVLGILDWNALNSGGTKNLENDLIRLVIDIRAKLKFEKKFQMSDEIRDRLKELGIILKDGKDRTDYIIS